MFGQAVRRGDDHTAGTGAMEHAPPTPRELIDDWKADAARRQLSAAHMHEVLTTLEHLADWLDAHGSGLATATPREIRAWLGEVAERGFTGKRKVGAKTLNNRLSVVRAFYEWCRRSEALPAGYTNPAAGIAQARTEKREGRCLTLDECLRMIAAAELDERSDRPHGLDAKGRVIVRSPLYRLLLATGLRIGAAERLQRKHFILAADPPHIIVPAGMDKSRTQRCLPISRADAEYFVDVLAGLEPDDVACRRPRAELLRRDAQQAGIAPKDATGRGIGFHAFRRAHGSELDRLGVGIRLIQKRYGHRRIETTMGYLTRPDAEQAGAMEALARAAGRDAEKSSTNAQERLASTIDRCYAHRAAASTPHEDNAGRGAESEPDPPTTDASCSSPVAPIQVAESWSPRERLNLLREHLDLMRALVGLEPTDEHSTGTSVRGTRSGPVPRGRGAGAAVREQRDGQRPVDAGDDRPGDRDDVVPRPHGRWDGPGR